MHACRPSILDVETEGSEAHGHPPLATQRVQCQSVSKHVSENKNLPPNAVILDASLLLRPEALTLELAFCRK